MKYYPKKNILFILACLLVLVAGGVAGREVLNEEVMSPEREVENRAGIPAPGPMPSENAHFGRYSNDEIDLAFDYPPDWHVEERGALANRPADAPDIAKHQITITEPGWGSVGIAVFPRRGNLRAWVRASHALAVKHALIDFNTSKGLVSGYEAYMWFTPAEGHDSAGYILLFQGPRYIYQVGFPSLGVSREGVQEILGSLRTGAGGSSDLPLQVSALPGLHPKVASCTNCNEQDSSTNPYSCCTKYGNCTWKVEQLRSGSNNFSFQGTTGRNAYRWMSLARSYTTYALGGTMPVTGAVLVAIDDFGGLGHVGTVKSISSDGSVQLTEQNCELTCTRTKTYSTSWLRTYLAGYIYSGNSAPTPTGKTISRTGSTTIEDYNFSNVYNFSTYGPGSVMSSNGNERAWGKSSSGSGGFMHFVVSKTGSTENYGRWRANIQEAGLYEVHVWIPNTTYAGAASLQYEVGGVLTNRINQSTNRGKWVRLSPAGKTGNFQAPSAGIYDIYLRDTRNSTAGQWIAFDAVKFIRLS